MTKNEYYTIKGYLNILESAPPNGRYIHRVRNKITGLRFSLFQQMPLKDHYEVEVRKLINDLLGSPEKTTTPVKDLDNAPGVPD